MFTLTTGSFRQIETAFLRDLGERREKDPLTSLLVLSPSGHMITRLQQEFAKGHGACLNVHFLTFYALADRVVSETAPTDRLVVEPAVYQEAIRELLEREGETELRLKKHLLPVDRPSSRGVPAALAATLKDLRDSGARVVDALRAALEGHLGAEAADAAPALELYARLYETLQKHGLRTSADQLRRAAQRIPSSPWIQGQKSIFLYGFYDLTGVQLDFVLAFSRHPDARVYVPHVEGTPAYAFAERLLKDPAFTSRVGTTVYLDDKDRHSPRPLAGNPLAVNGRMDPLPATAGDDDFSLRTSPAVEIWNCSGLYDEVWLAAKKILRLASDGIPYSRMLLSARLLGPYLSAIREAFQAHHIPYSLEQEEPVGAYPLVKTVRQLFLLARQDFPIGHTFDVLKSPYFSERAGLPAGRQAVAGSLETVQTWSEHVLWAERFLSRWLRLPPNASEEEKRLWESVRGALGGLSTLDALGRPVSRERFLELLENKLDKLSVRLAPANNQGVQALDVMAARGLSFEAVFLLGLNEKSFPRLIREDPFLSDAARSALSEALGCRLSRKLNGYEEERLLFVLAQGLAEKQLHVSYQRSDDEGKALIPSLYLNEFVDEKASRCHLARALGEKWRQIPPTELTPKEVSVLLNRENKETDDFYRFVGYDHRFYNALRQAQRQLESFQDPLGPRDGLIGPDPLLKKIQERGFSPDALTDLAECPFRYYIGKVLGLQADEETANGGDLAADISGKLIHQILEMFYKDVFKIHELIKKENIHDQLNQACEKAFSVIKETTNLYPLAWIATQQKIRARLLLFLAADLEELKESGFNPTFFEEWTDGKMAETASPITSTLFRGRIDRIDLRQENGQTAYRVVDYKTGRASRKGARTETMILRGGYLQLPIYLSLVGPWLEKKLGKPVRAVAACFYNLADWEKGQYSPSVGPEFWPSYGKAFSENLAGLLALVEKGIFYIRPSEDQGYCGWCDFSQICRKEHKPSAARSLASPVRRANDKRLGRKAND